MQEISSIRELRDELARLRQGGRRVGLVPTMGALHRGHLALVDDARSLANVVVMSLFVNPLQFRPGEDFERYPRDLERDRTLAASRGVDVLFTPGVEEMYGAGRDVRVLAGETAALWEGAVRPGHFDGVLTVVAKLFNLVQPEVASFGQKDIQQVTLVRQLIEQLNFPVQLSVVPTVREADGLALSSRNVYLGTEERAAATALSRGLRAALLRWEAGERSAAALREAVRAVLDATSGIATDYIAVADGTRLLPVDRAESGTVIAVAARVGTTRLIDNVILGQKGP
jgi:pantoate--beta-alanine ligase